MVSASTILAICVTLCVSVVLPVVVLIVYGCRNKGKKVWPAWFLGAAGFFVTQIVIRVPILGLLSGNDNFLSFSQNHYILYCLLLAATAALFEAAGRYAVAKILQKKGSAFERGLAAGLGHGGIEAIVLIGTTYLNNLIYAVMINTGSFGAVIEQTGAMGMDTSALVQVQEVLTTSNAVVFYLADYERILTMVFHAFLSLLMWDLVMRKKDKTGIAVCFLLHCMVDFVTPVMNGMATENLGNKISSGTAYVFVYVFLTVIAILSAVGIRQLQKKWKS